MGFQGLVPPLKIAFAPDSALHTLVCTRSTADAHMQCVYCTGDQNLGLISWCLPPLSYATVMESTLSTEEEKVIITHMAMLSIEHVCANKS